MRLQMMDKGAAQLTGFRFQLAAKRVIFGIGAAKVEREPGRSDAGRNEKFE